MRDLNKERPDNVVRLTDEGDDTAPFVAEVTNDTRTAIRQARQDQNLAAIAGLLVRAAEALEPVTALLSRRLLAWATVGTSVGLAAYAIRHAADGAAWERLAVLAVFMLCAPWLVRRLG